MRNLIKRYSYIKELNLETEFIDYLPKFLEIKAYWLKYAKRIAKADLENTENLIRKNIKKKRKEFVPISKGFARKQLGIFKLEREIP